MDAVARRVRAHHADVVEADACLQTTLRTVYSKSVWATMYWQSVGVGAMHLLEAV
jgi:hypothetical protein